MRSVFIQDWVFTGNKTIDFNCDQLGARSCLVIAEASNSGSMNFIGGNGAAFAVSQSLVGGNWGNTTEMYQFAFPIGWPFLRMQATTVNPFNFRMILLDDVVNPWGTIPVDFSHNVNIAASGTNAIFANKAAGTLLRSLTVSVDMTKAGHVDYGCGRSGTAPKVGTIITIPGVNGGAQQSQRVPMSTTYSVTLINDDAANANTMNVTLTGHLEAPT